MEDTGERDPKPGGLDATPGHKQTAGSEARDSSFAAFARRAKRDIQQLTYKHLNFFRIHLAYFVLATFLGSVILYGSSPKENKLPYIDCLFLSISAMTETGLVTYPISQLTVWQQVCLFLQILFGSLIFVSWSMVLVRRHMFRRKFREAIRQDAFLRQRMLDIEASGRQEREQRASRVWHWLGWGQQDASLVAALKEASLEAQKTEPPPGPPSEPVDSPSEMLHPADAASAHGSLRTNASQEPHSVHTVAPDATTDQASVSALERRGASLRSGYRREHGSMHPDKEHGAAEPHEHPSEWEQKMAMSKSQGMGDFPTVFDYARALLNRVYPKLRQRFQRKGKARSVRFKSSKSTEPQAPGGEDGQLAPYLTFDATVAGNSHFTSLSSEQQEELGGVEYRALGLLKWMIPIYWFTLVSLATVITLPYLCSPAGASYRAELKNQAKGPRVAWFWIFHVESAFANTGMSLYDNSLKGPVFNHGWMFVFPTAVLIVLGNTGYPMALHMIVWTMSRLVRRDSQMYETLRFLLDHPRRCFLFMFPAQQTWFLFWVVFTLTMVDWLFVLLLNIDISRTMPHGVWVADGLFHAISTRAAGFVTFDLLSLSPAELLLQVVMMYLAIFPIALTVRSTNVYEEHCLGIYDKGDEDAEFPVHHGWNLWGRFFWMYVRHQLAYDFGWLPLAVWVVCIVEKDHLQDHRTDSYMSIFNVLYELTAAYSNVGFTTGSPNGVALSGSFHTLSKLVMCAVMIRGRHQEMPYAIDRAVLLPDEVREHDMWHDASMQHALWPIKITPRTDTSGPGAVSVPPSVKKEELQHASEPRSNAAPSEGYDTRARSAPPADVAQWRPAAGDSSAPAVVLLDSALRMLHLGRSDLVAVGKGVSLTVMSELGDKTFLMAAILAMRNPAYTVFWGSWAAMVCMSMLSALMGAVLPALLPERGAMVGTALLFFGFGCAMVWQSMHMRGDELRQEWAETQDEIRVDEEEHELDDIEQGQPHTDAYPAIQPYPPKPAPMPTVAPAAVVDAVRTAPRTSTLTFVKEGTRNLCGLCFSPAFSQAFLLSFLGEWGDRSQITTVALAATHNPAIVALSTSFGHLLCVALAVSAGAMLATRLSVKHVTIASAALFILFGFASAYEAYMYTEAPTGVSSADSAQSMSTGAASAPTAFGNAPFPRIDIPSR